MFTYGTHRALASVETTEHSRKHEKKWSCADFIKGLRDPHLNLVKIHIALTWKLMMRSSHKFAHTTTDQLKALSTFSFGHYAIKCDIDILQIYCIALDNPKFMGHPPDHSWWKTGLSESFLGCPNYFDSSLKDIRFIIINKKFASFLFNHVLTYREVGRPSGDFGGHVGTPDRVMDHIWRLGDLLSTALLLYCWNEMQQLIHKLI